MTGAAVADPARAARRRSGRGAPRGGAAAPSIRVAVVGAGAVGQAVARLLREGRRGARLVGIADRCRPRLLARRPEVAIVCTGAHLDVVAEQLAACVEAGANVVSACEELVHPFGRSAGHARHLDALARAAGVTVLGTGANPGFLFDGLLAALSGVCWDVTAIRGRRVLDLGGASAATRRRLGIGLAPARFRADAEVGLAGHVGFAESIELLCARLGLRLDGPVAETVAPFVGAGRVEGFRQQAVGCVDGAERLRLELVAHVRPRAAGCAVVDRLELDGAHPVRLTIEPALDSVRATAALLVNRIPDVLRARPGLTIVTDLPAPAACLGDLRGADARQERAHR